MYDRRLTHSREADEILRENFGELVYNTRIRKTIRFAEAPVKGSLRARLRADGRGGRACTATSRRRCSMARNRASMREGPARRALPRDRSGTAAGGAAKQELPTEPPRREPPVRACSSARADAARREPTACSRPRSARSRLRPSPSRRRAQRRRSRAGSTRCPSSPRASSARRDARVVPRRHPRRRRRRRGPERGRPDDRRRHHAGRLHRGQHRHPAAADERRADEDPHRQRADRGPRLRRRPRDRPPCGRGGLRRDQALAARLRHGLRHRRRGWRHRLRRRAGRRAHRARARRAHRRHRDDAVQVRGHTPRRSRPTTGCRRCARPATR